MQRSATIRRLGGFSLLELLVVLTLLVILLSLAAPSILAPLRGSRLKNAADTICAEFAKARVEAMESGRVRMFRFQTDTGNYQVEPWLRASDTQENNIVGEGERVIGNGLIEQSVEATTRQGTLAEGVTFMGEQVDVDMRSYETTDGQIADGQAGYSRPILFYPDGTTSDAAVVMKSEDGGMTMVKLRGLTGIAKIGEYQSTEDLSQ
ncbi:prepilin-type N-terminal cleavage/methylation domain-containing protein [Blastopirellula sp. JC732]|uniref:Prepilin-type N-terminal cleavage/methylation domain-containing protein n=1 Tax=Blastopirellula sediminis TaxID=2894196 RepID=A0A9X1MI41_9BACT|nr:prepilin-type N-terminal cleavage/methylation domain-containing protein [Blastopirellula sediminis]MCC9608221.1 prepilin-type N-terminal cleavage/methylation domain-containing protein [Blastopirellula sediminis]MCC9626986.1 prepilin-type N-terminal cleavage/methylation domain-containing protein [Blastopirellula sediminis]